MKNQRVQNRNWEATNRTIWGLYVYSSNIQGKEEQLRRTKGLSAYRFKIRNEQQKRGTSRTIRTHNITFVNVFRPINFDKSLFSEYLAAPNKGISSAITNRYSPLISSHCSRTILRHRTKTIAQQPQIVTHRRQSHDVGTKAHDVESIVTIEQRPNQINISLLLFSMKRIHTERGTYASPTEAKRARTRFLKEEVLLRSRPSSADSARAQPHTCGYKYRQRKQ